MAGGAQVTLTWSPVRGAIGYQVHVADSADGPWEPLDHHGRDVTSVPHPPYVDTTGSPGVERWYAVSSLSDVHVDGPPSSAVSATPLAEATGPVTVAVDASTVVGELDRPWRPMIGSEHLSHALSTDTTGGRVVGEELSAALSAAHQELGVTHVRAHGILCDDLAVYREVDGEPVHDFTGIDRVYDHIRSIGLYPVVEISFMPHDLASDPTKTVFGYDAIISPPKDWQRWFDLVRDLTAHLVERYGDEVVEQWSFEVWNEANLEVFWSGQPEDYLKLYDVTAAAVREVDSRLVVGGPSSAAAGWVEELLAHAEKSGAPVDFVSTHTYGAPPLDFRPMLARHGRDGTPIWWTEWGVTPTHFNEVSDAVFSGAFLLRGMKSAMGRIESLAYWVVSDHFEELGRPPELLHGGFGLRTVGELRKPRWWALAMMERLGSHRLAVSSLGRRRRLARRGRRRRRPTTARSRCCCGTSPSTRARRPGPPALGRDVVVEVRGLAAGSSYTLRHDRVDEDHSNVASAWARLRDPARPGRPTSSGRPCARPTSWPGSSPTGSSTADESGVVTSTSCCRCRR